MTGWAGRVRVPLVCEGGVVRGGREGGGAWERLGWGWGVGRDRRWVFLEVASGEVGEGVECGVGDVGGEEVLGQK